MSCEFSERLRDEFATATRALGEYVDSNEQIVKDSTYYVEHERLERIRRESSFALTEHRDRCNVCSGRGGS